MNLVKTTFRLAFLATLLVIVTASKNSQEVITSAESNSIEEKVSTSDQNSLQPHHRSKRTIGHIFDMFKNMMSGLFGGKGKKNRGRGRGKGRRPGQPPQRPRRPQRPPQRPQLSGGYSGGNAPPLPPTNQYGGPQPVPQQNPFTQSSYGQQSVPNQDSYGSPQASPVSNQDSYGSPQAPPVQAQDSYGSPQAPPVQAQDSYGSPQAPPVQAQDSYGSPQAPPVQAQDSYGSPQAAPVGPINNYGAVPQAPRAPQAPRQNNRPQSTEFGPSSVFYMIPAPNLATEAPQGGRGAAQDSYGSPQASPQGQRQNQDSYGSPQASPVGPTRQNQDSYGSPQSNPVSGQAPIQNQDSYGSPNAGVIVSGRGNSAPLSNSITNSYSQPQSNPVSNSYSQPQAISNPFLSQSQYGNSAQPLPITNNDLSGSFVSNEDSYGSPQQQNQNSGDSYGSPQGGNPPPAPITDVDLPETPEIVTARAPQNQDQYGSLAPVGTSAPVPEDVLNELRGDEAPEGELADLQVDGEGEATPLFEDLRNVAFTSADDQTSTESYDDREPIEVDLSNGIVDLTNGLDLSSSGPGEVDLTNYNQEQDQETTLAPVDYRGDYDDEYEYIGDEDVPPELPEELYDVRSEEFEYDEDDESLAGAILENQESYGQQAATQDDDSEYEYYYDYEEYEYNPDPEQLPDNLDSYGGNQEQYTTASPLASSTANFISVPLMIEEVAKDTAPVILAGSSDSANLADSNSLSSYGGNRNTKRRAPHTSFHQFLVESPQAKRQADWSQRLGARRNRVWRQFNLD